MSTTNQNLQRWDTAPYRRIERVRYDEDSQQLTVTFQDGSAPTFDPTPLLPPETDFDDIDWWRTAANEIEIIVPIGNAWFEIPYDVIRRHTDPEYEAFWVELTKRGMERIGARLRALREERRLSVETVATRAGFAVNTLRDLEAGEADPWLDHRPVLAAMGYPEDALITVPNTAENVVHNAG